MLMGASNAWACPRRASHTWSRHSYCERSQTTEAVCGRTSAAKPNGSAFSIRYGENRGLMLYLYSVPWRIPGTKPSQMPDDWRGWSGVAAGSQLLKSPMTLTVSAFGAQTENTTPGVPSTVTTCAPSLSWIRTWVPSLNRYRSKSVSKLGWVLAFRMGACVIGILLNRGTLRAGPRVRLLDDGIDSLERQQRSRALPKS